MHRWRTTRTLRRALAALACGCATAGVPALAAAQQSGNPGDIIVERDITPRSAFGGVPKNQDPVTVSVTTFPAATFNRAMATLVSDSELTSAHGSVGVVPSGVGAANVAGMQAITSILSGRQTGSNVARGAGGQVGGVSGIGGTISATVTGALAPLTGALGALK